MSAGQHVLAGTLARLVPLSEEHLARSLQWVNDPYIMATVLRVLPVSWDDQSRWFAALERDPAKLVWAIMMEEMGHVGNTGLYHIDRHHRRAEFWIYLGAPASRGKGVAGDALRLAMSFAFKDMDLNRLYLHVGMDNQPAHRLYTRNGFKHEGLLRQHYLLGGKPVDVAVMSILKSEYDQTQQLG